RMWYPISSSHQKYPGSRMPVPQGKNGPFRQCVRYWGLGPCVLPHTKDFSRASCYQLALEQVHSHPKAQGALGPLLNIHYLKLTNKHNFVDIADAKLKILLIQKCTFQRWHLDEVFLEPKDCQQIPVFKLSGENGEEVKKK
uniref:Uncharacterized protein n=1 Tax=Theropithecus gelada TaxID=9565 RepID=A0A8D2EP28_THEGE